MRILLLLLICCGVRFAVAQDAPDSHAELIAKIRPSVVTIRVQGRDGNDAGIGTGFAIQDNLIATNFHVINEGRPFTIESSDGEPCRVLAVEASDINNDLVLIRVDNASNLPALRLSETKAEQGQRVLAFGNPRGLKNSVVEGIVSAIREVENQELLQLAMPIEPGNSGGPLVDLQGNVHGIINMKSAINDNLGFAIPIRQLQSLRDAPNPVAFGRWIRLGTINADRWEPLMGGTWQQKGCKITARGSGNGFGGRSLCLYKIDPPKVPYEIAVDVKLDDEAGAAGLVFHSDGGDKHYGFYPSAGNVRLSCFRGPTVYSWRVLKDVSTEHYLPGHWNRLKVRVESSRILCFVNGHQVIESADHQFTAGRVGLAKFRLTQPSFKRFFLAKEVPSPTLTASAKESLDLLKIHHLPVHRINARRLRHLGESSELASRELLRRAAAVEEQAAQLRRLADDVVRAQTIKELGSVMASSEPNQLVHASMLLAQMDNPEMDLAVYFVKIDQMVSDIRASFPKDANAVQKRNRMHRYLFKENGFHGSRSEYYHPANSHLHRVIDDREGLPITLSILYMELGRRLGLKFEGVGLPGHFVVRHIFEGETQLIDVFERGKLLTQQDANAIVVSRTSRDATELDFQANSNRQILTRMLQNLVGVAASREDGESILGYSEALVAVNPTSTQFRMMRAQMRGMTSRWSAAIEDLDWLLEKDPPDLDRDVAERMRAALDEKHP